MARRPYPWFKFWPDILRNPKIRGLTPRQFQDWLFVLCAASEQKKRWHFPDDRTAGKIIGFPIGRFRKLIELGLLDRVDDGICVHDYEDWQEIYPSDLNRNSLGIDSAKAPHRRKKQEGRGEKKESFYDSLRESGLTPRRFFEKKLGEAENRCSVVGQAFQFAFNQKPDYGRLGALTNSHGGELPVLIKLLNLAGQDIEGDAHDYLQASLRRAEQGQSGRSPEVIPVPSGSNHEYLPTITEAPRRGEPVHIAETLSGLRFGERKLARE